MSRRVGTICQRIGCTLMLSAVMTAVAGCGDREPAGRGVEWELVAAFGAVRTVYVRDDVLQDRERLADIVRFVTNGGRALNQDTDLDATVIQFYNSLDATPTTCPPMTDDQMLHWKAQYTVSSDELREFTITDPNAEDGVEQGPTTRLGVGD